MRFGQKSRGRLQQCFRPSLEGLESRQCLAVTVAAIAKPNGTELKITGDAAANVINIVDQGNGRVDVTNGNGKLLGAADGVRAIKLDAKGGADAITYSLAATLTQAQSLFFDLGAGKDLATLDLSQGVSGANLKVAIEGGDGADTIDILAGNVAAAKLKLDVNGGGGKDEIRFQGSGLSVDVDSAIVAHFAGGDGADTIDTNLDGQFVGRVNYTANGNAGADTVTANLTAALGSTGKVRAIERGAKGIDNLTLNVFDNSSETEESALEVLNAKLFDKIGGDTLTYTDNVVVITNAPV